MCCTCSNKHQKAAKKSDLIRFMQKYKQSTLMVCRKTRPYLKMVLIVQQHVTLAQQTLLLLLLLFIILDVLHFF